MKKSNIIIITLLTLIAFTLFNCEQVDKEKNNSNFKSIEIPISIFYNSTSENLSYGNLSPGKIDLEPKSIYINDNLVYISINKKIFVINTENHLNPYKHLLIENDDYNLIQTNSSNNIVADESGNIYYENIQFKESEVKLKNTKKKESILEKIQHRILKFDYEGNYLFSIGPKASDGISNFSDKDTIEQMTIDEKNNLSIIIKKFRSSHIEIDYDLLTNKSEKSSPDFIRKNIDFFSYHFLKYNTKGKIIYTLNLEEIKDINISSDKFIRIIQDIKINPKGNKLIIATKDYFKNDTINNNYTIENSNLIIYIYDLSLNKLIDKKIQIDDNLFNLFGISKDDNIYLSKPYNSSEFHFIVLDINGNIIENKKIFLNNIRQTRYDLFFNPEGYISSAFIERDKIRIIQYK